MRTCWPQGQFIYIKYAFEELMDTRGNHCQLTRDELSTRMKPGLSGMYQRIMDTLREAFKADGMEHLQDLMLERLLPVLVASRAPLTVEELVWATGAEADQVCSRFMLLHQICVPALNPSNTCSLEAFITAISHTYRLMHIG